MPKSREKNRTGRENRSPLKEIVISASLGLGEILILLAVFSLVMSAQDIPEKWIPGMVTVVLVVSTFLAGSRCGRRLRQNGMVYGALTGGLMFLILFTTALAIPHNEAGLPVLYKGLIMATGSAIGCVLAVNHREKGKVVRSKRR